MFEKLKAIWARISDDPHWPDDHRVFTPLRTLAGVPINADTAITIPAVWACLRYLSQTVAVLPWHVMKDGEKGAEIQSKNMLDYLLWKRPSKEWSSLQFRETLLHWALRWGNGWAEIERDQIGRPYALWPIHPERVRLCRDEGDNSLFLEVSNGTGGTVDIEYEDVFHLRGFGEGVLGMNVMQYAAESLGWSRAVQLFGASFFGNGMNISGVVVNKRPLKDAGLKRQRAEFENLYKGPRNANKTAIIDNDADWKPIGVDPQKSQLTDTNMFLIEEVCRWFGVPPHKVMHLARATFSNIEHQAIEVVVDSVSPWVKRFEDEADFKLMGQNRQNLYSKMNMRALMRGDNQSRIQYYDGMVKIGAYSPNRVLELEDENTIGPDGDIHTMQSQNVTLETIKNPPQPVAATPAPKAPAVDPKATAGLEEYLRIMGHEDVTVQ